MSSTDPTKSYNIAVTFTGLAGLTAGKTAGGRCYIKNRNTREIKYYDGKGKTAITAGLIVDLKSFASYANGQVLEVGMMGEEYGTAIHTINTTKGGVHLSIAVTETTTTTHPNVTL